MKLLICLATGAALVLSTAAQSRQGEVKVVRPSATVSKWANAVSQRLDRVLSYPVPFSNEMRSSGIVTVRFEADAQGQPIAIRIARTSRHRALDKAALRAVNRIGTLPPMPAAFARNQPFVANILFATSQIEHDRQVALLRRETMTRRTASAAPGVPVAMVITSSADAGS